MSGVPRVDVHTHLAPALDPQRLADLGVAEADGQYVLGGRPVGPPGLYQPGRLTGWLEQVGLDRGWVSVPPPFFRQGQGAATAAWVQAVNDGLVARLGDVAALDALAYLPLNEPEVAVAELDRWTGRPEVHGWVGSAGGGSLPLDDPALAPVWAAVAASGRPLLLHPGSSPDARLEPHYLANLLGNPLETTVAAAQMVLGGVLQGHPELRVLLVHCGGGVPLLAGRWQRGLDTRRPGVAELTLTPRDAVRRFWVDALGHDPAVVDLAAAVLGPDKLVLGSDWPFPMGLEDPWSAVAHLPQELQDQIGRANAAALSGGSR